MKPYSLDIQAPVATLPILWAKLPDFPVQGNYEWDSGLAGTIAGAHGPWIMIAGGANFTKSFPWKGGTKHYHDSIYLLNTAANEHAVWKQAEQKLSKPLAYSAVVESSDGIIVLGGETPDGLSAAVQRLSFDNGIPVFENLPNLPNPVAAASAVIIDQTLFVIGGTRDNEYSNEVLSLSLAPGISKWEHLTSLPNKITHAVAVAQFDGIETCLYLLGGRNKNSNIHSFSSQIWKFSPSTDQWTLSGQLMHGRQPISLSAGTGVAFGNNAILMIGGDPGILFNQTERINLQLEAAAGIENTTELLALKHQLLTSHPGFSRDILIFNTHSNSCGCLETVNFDLPVSSRAFSLGNRWILPPGEIRPGCRSSEVRTFTIKQHE